MDNELITELQTQADRILRQCQYLMGLVHGMAPNQSAKESATESVGVVTWSAQKIADLLAIARKNTLHTPRYIDMHAPLPEQLSAETRAELEGYAKYVQHGQPGNDFQSWLKEKWNASVAELEEMPPKKVTKKRRIENT